MNDKYLTEKGYKQYPPTVFDNDSIVARFQKRFDDTFGKKYFIDILKWSWEFIPPSRRDEYWTQFTYTYEAQITMFEESKAIDFDFHSNWTLEEVEKFMEDFFATMKPNYYEDWDGCRRVVANETNKK